MKNVLKFDGEKGHSRDALLSSQCADPVSPYSGHNPVRARRLHCTSPSACDVLEPAGGDPAGDELGEKEKRGGASPVTAESRPDGPGPDPGAGRSVGLGPARLTPSPCFRDNGSFATEISNAAREEGHALGRRGGTAARGAASPSSYPVRNGRFDNALELRSSSVSIHGSSKVNFLLRGEYS